MKTLILTLTLLFSSLVFAECPTFRFIDKGEAAPCDGAFFNREAEAELKRQHSQMKGDIEVLEKKLDLTELQVEAAMSKAGIYEAEMKRQEKMRKELEGDFRRGIIVGVLGTAAVIFLAGQLVR